MATEQNVESKGRWTALFVHGGFGEKEGEKSLRINDFRSEWNCQKPSALFTLLLSTHGEPEPVGLPAQGETGHSGSPVCTSGSQLGKRREDNGRRGDILCCQTSGKTWMIHRDTSSMCFGSVGNLPAKRKREKERREVEISLNSSVSARVVQIRIAEVQFKHTFV